MRLFPRDRKTSGQEPSQHVMFYRNQASNIPVGVLGLGPCLRPKNNTDIDKCRGFGTV
jgi:hypothetical protein